MTRRRLPESNDPLLRSWHEALTLYGRVSILRTVIAGGAIPDERHRRISDGLWMRSTRRRQAWMKSIGIAR